MCNYFEKKSGRQGVRGDGALIKIGKEGAYIKEAQVGPGKKRKEYLNQSPKGYHKK